MLYYDTPGRNRLAREHADRLAEDMRSARGPLTDEPEAPRGGLSAELFALVGRLRRHGRGRHVPAYHS
jgi:hypothetical protein